MPRHKKHRRNKNHSSNQKAPSTPAILTKEPAADGKLSYFSYLSVPKGFLANSLSLLTAVSKFVPAAAEWEECVGNSISGTFSGTSYTLYETGLREVYYDHHMGSCNFSPGTQTIFDGVKSKIQEVCGNLTASHCTNFSELIVSSNDIDFLRCAGEPIQKQFENCVVKLIADEKSLYENQHTRPWIVLGLVVAGIVTTCAVSVSAFYLRSRMRSCLEQRRLEQIAANVGAKVEANVEATSQNNALNEQSPLFPI
jgi:hypothetical protein